MNITLLPIEELRRDRQDSIDDIHICNMAIALGIEVHRDGSSVRNRIDVNKAIVEKIDAEIARREASKWA